MEFPLDIETGRLSPSAQKAVVSVKEALKKTGHVAESGLEEAAKAVVMALAASGNLRVGD